MGPENGGGGTAVSGWFGIAITTAIRSPDRLIHAPDGEATGSYIMLMPLALAAGKAGALPPSRWCATPPGYLGKEE